MPNRDSIRNMLAPGRRLDAGRVCEVVTLLEAHPARLTQLVKCLWDSDLGVANRAADVLERLTRERPERAQRWKDPLLGLLAEAAANKLDKKLRWNLALIVPRLKLTVPECRRVAALLRSWLDGSGLDGSGLDGSGLDPSGPDRSDPGSIVKTAALHGLADLTRQDPASLPAAIELLQLAGRSGTPAMRARSRILLKELESKGKKRHGRSSLHIF